MMPYLCAIALVLLAGCADAPIADTQAAVVVTRTEPLEVPTYAPREVPPELVSPLYLDMPVLTDDASDYGMSRDSVIAYRRLVAAFARYRKLCIGFAQE